MAGGSGADEHEPDGDERGDGHGDGDLDDNGSASLAFLRELAHVSDRTATPADDAAPDEQAVVASGRFVIHRRLGSGGFGTVYEAFDRDRDATVALKVLRRRDPRSLAAFKTEFRSLVETVHDNLVQLYELHAAGGVWFFTMELVRGTDALEHLRPAGGPCDEARLRSLFGQLADGLSFLHRTGKLHRDIKPSNVMVTTGGRVVIVDFGLIGELSELRSSELVVGTPAYMAPEQAAGLPIDTAADWYAVGVMLYQALTGRLPSHEVALGPTWPHAADDARSRLGRASTIFDEQATVDDSVAAPRLERCAPPPPSALADVPADLDRLCVELLARIPARRPPGREVRRRLATAWSPSGAAIAIPRPSPRAAHAGGVETTFVGRERHLAQLAAALAAAEDGAAVVVLVHGSSGMGKSALVHQFLAEVRAGDPERLVLFGRCFPQESAPYKGVDGLIDELDRRLRARPRAERAGPGPGPAPADAAMLARLFPQLQGPDGVPPPADDDGPRLRARAFAALRELLAQASVRVPVLAVDDLQWGNLDGAALLAALLDGGRRAPVLLIATCRAEDAASNPVLRELMAAIERRADQIDVRHLDVGALDEREAAALSRALLAGERPGEDIATETVAALVEEARGDPFLITELTRHRPGVAGRRDYSLVAAPATFDLGVLLAARIDDLPAAARRLLDVVALAGQPIARAVAVRAAYGDDPADALGAISVLRAGRLIRSGRADDGEELVPYHDRIRELMTRRLDGDADAARTHHHRLAVALEEAGGCEPERLMFHHRSAGRLAEAARHAADAARRAHAALAFDRAARLYRDALALRDDRELRVALADALAGAGRPHEAALAYLDAAGDASATDALVHRRRAAELLVGAGYVDEGLAALRCVLHDVDVSLPASLPRSLAGLAALRVRLGVRGLAFRERTEATVGDRALRRIDTCFTAALGLFIVNPVLAAEVHARHLLAALDAGEPFRVARALFFEAVMASFLRRRGPTNRLLDTARALERRLAIPYLGGLARLCESWIAMSGKRWRLVHDRALDSERLLRGCTAVSTELDFARLARSEALWRLGEVAELARVVPPLVEEARERGNRYLEMMVRLAGGAFVGLAEGRPDRAQASVAAALDRWPAAPGSILHARRVRIEARIALYQGQPRAALAVIDAGLAALRRTGLGFVPVVTGEIRVVRAFAALSIGDDARAARHARATAGLGPPWAGIVADLVAAATARRAGDARGGLRLLARAEVAARAHDAALFAAAMARRRGEWTGGADGHAQIDAADAWMTGQGIVEPERMTGMLIGWT